MVNELNAMIGMADILYDHGKNTNEKLVRVDTDEPGHSVTLKHAAAGYVELSPITNSVWFCL
jgi:hypothetical protein